MNILLEQSICKSRNGESNNGMRGLRGMWGGNADNRGENAGNPRNGVGMRTIRVGMQGMEVGLWGTE